MDGLWSDQSIYDGSVDIPREVLVRSFVERLYILCLSRSGEPQGIADWTNQLISGASNGTEVAYGFFFSSELTNKNLSNADFVEILYRAILGRDSDAAGKQDWCNRLAGGSTRLDIFYGFVNSKEFGEICARYGIRRNNESPAPGNPGPHTEDDINDIIDRGSYSEDDLKKLTTPLIQT